ncbi:MAG: 16S rRNA (cytidine(1402)-2'-O)-methyltransferase [Sphingobacteriaceae bacterium]|nr:16S rRNA (cytidine(1402)-2'-O)-methyltransferase [Sphingobacteriaceae bacterium]
MSNGKLYILATPIGNLEDISLRTLRLLKEADLVLCEDTRTSGILLKHYEIKQPLQSYHKFNEHQLTEKVIAQLQAGKTIALISDAGTPGISDPGFLLARAAVAAGLEVEAPPGATALIPALVKSGLPSDRFCFEGFLPQKKGRQTRFKQLAEEMRTMVFYESPYRVLKTLEELAQYCGAERQASVSREITKKFEETLNGTLADLIQHFKTHAPKGEFVIVLAGRN